MYLLIYVFLVMGRFVGGALCQGQVLSAFNVPPCTCREMAQMSLGFLWGEGGVLSSPSPTMSVPDIVGQGRYVNLWPIHTPTHPSHPPTQPPIHVPHPPAIPHPTPWSQKPLSYSSSYPLTHQPIH